MKKVHSYPSTPLPTLTDNFYPFFVIPSRNKYAYTSISISTLKKNKYINDSIAYTLFGPVLFSVNMSGTSFMLPPTERPYPL